MQDLIGWDIWSFSSLVHFYDDFVVNFTIMALIVIGGLGFIVWADFQEKTNLNLRNIACTQRL